MSATSKPIGSTQPGAPQDPPAVSAYPLSWPPGRPRTPETSIKPARFRTMSETHIGRSQAITLGAARARLATELERVSGEQPILSTNLELRIDGTPRANTREPRDTGVACYFRLRGRPVVLSCDRWDTVAGNIAAIASHIEALRGQERWGVGTLEQAFAGFLALPSPADVGDRLWWAASLDHPRDLIAAEAAYKRLMMAAHPDRGGTQERAAELNCAIQAARGYFR